MVEDHSIPIRLDIEHDTHRIKDTFMWNCADTTVTPEMFAQQMCEDYKVPTGIFTGKIASTIREKVGEYWTQVKPIEPAEEEGQGRGRLKAGENWLDFTVKDEPVLTGKDEVMGEGVKREPGLDNEIDSVRVVAHDEEPVVEDVELKKEGEEKEGKGVDRPMTVEEAMRFVQEGPEDLRILVKVSFRGKNCRTV